MKSISKFFKSCEDNFSKKYISNLALYGNRIVWGTDFCSLWLVSWGRVTYSKDAFLSTASHSNFPTYSHTVEIFRPAILFYLPDTRHVIIAIYKVMVKPFWCSNHNWQGLFGFDSPGIAQSYKWEQRHTARVKTPSPAYLCLIHEFDLVNL